MRKTRRTRNMRNAARSMDNLASFLAASSAPPDDDDEAFELIVRRRRARGGTTTFTNDPLNPAHYLARRPFYFSQSNNELDARPPTVRCHRVPGADSALATRRRRYSPSSDACALPACPFGAPVTFPHPTVGHRVIKKLKSKLLRNREKYRAPIKTRQL